MRDFKNILITGGLGFIGSNFLDLVLEDKGLNVINIDNLSAGSNIENDEKHRDNKNYKHYPISITNPNLDSLVDMRKVDCIYHFAAESHVDRSIEDSKTFLETNILGTFNLLEVVRKIGQAGKNIHFHHISTDEVYGSLEKGEESFLEENKYRPNSPYSASKASSDHLVRAWKETYGLSVTTSHCSNNYGPKQNSEKLIPKVLKCALSGQKIPIYGSGTNIRDWLYVEDHCKAIYEISKNGESGEVFNIGGDCELTNLQLIENIISNLDILSPVSKGSPFNNTPFEMKDYRSLISFVEDRKGHDFRYSVNFSKIRDRLQWKPSVEINSGLAKTINWYLNNLKWLS